MRLWVLGSGSGGNAVLVEVGESRVLVDAGFAPRTLARRLHSIGVAPTSIEACIVTHEHGDHVRGAAAGAHRWGWSLYASAGTRAAWPALDAVGCRSLSPGSTLALSRLSVEVRSTPHDAAHPVGVRLTATGTGASAVVCTDVGHVSDEVRTLCTGADLLIVESNHDEGMLRAGPYPVVVQRRIASPIGHLSNAGSSALLRDVARRELAHVVLAHLSERCNHPQLAYRTAGESLRRTRFRGALSVALQDGVVGPFRPGSTRAQPADQLVLEL